MNPIRSAEILCVGTELLLGDIVNTDAAYLSRRLAALGIHQYYQSVVGDNPARLEEMLRIALSRSDLVILTGGLGPTYDDLTKETAARIMGKKLVFHEESWERMLARMTKHGHPISPNNKKQAYMPEDGVVFKNNYGTAPGCAMEADGHTVIMLPGPPRELEPMFAEEVEPWLARFSDHVLVSKNVNIFGMGESRVEDTLRGLMTESANPTVAPYAKDGEVLLRVTARGATEAEGAALCDETIAKIMVSPVAPFVYGVDAGSLEAALVGLLIKKGLRVTCAESCTGGYIAKRITNVSGASEVFDGSVVTYANRIKEKLVGVSHKTLEAYGAVSEQTAREMAEGVRALFDADIGIASTGIAGPGGGTPEKPVGLVYVAAASRSGRIDVRELRIGNGLATREYVRYVASSNALDLARRVLTD